MNCIRNHINKFYFKLDFIEIKKNFINISTKRILIIKNPHYEYFHKNPFLKTYLKRVRFYKKNYFNRKDRLFNISIKNYKKSFSFQIDKLLFYEKYKKKEKIFLESLTINKRIYFLFKKFLGSLLGLLFFFKIKYIKRFNYLLLFSLIFYFGLDEIIFSYLLDPKLESNLYDITNFAYVPDQITFRRLIEEKSPENSLAARKNIVNKEKLSEFRESFEEKELIKRFIEKRLLKYERLKILIMGRNYAVNVKSYEPDDIFDNIEKNKRNYFLNDYWQESFILRRIHNLLNISYSIFKKIKYLLFGEKSFTHHFMSMIGFENFYNYRKLTFNERMRKKIEYIKTTKAGIGFLEYFDKKITPLIKDYLRQYILEFLKDKKIRENLFNWLASFLFVKIEFRDFLLEKICEFLDDWIESPGFDNVKFFKIKTTKIAFNFIKKCLYSNFN